MKNIKKIITLSFITAIICATPINAMLSRAGSRVGNIAARALIRTTHHSPQLTGTKPQSRLFTQAKKQTFFPTPKNTFSRAQSTTTLWSWKKAAGLLGTAGALGYTLSNQEKAHAKDNTDYSVESLKQDPNKIGIEVIHSFTNEYNNLSPIQKLWSSNKLKLLLNDKTTAPIIIKVAAQNITKINYNTLPHIIKYNSDAAPIIIKVAAQNITKINYNTLEIIILCAPGAAEKLAKAAAHNIPKISEENIIALIKNNPDNTQTLAKAAAQNITEMKVLPLKRLIYHNRDDAQIFATAAAKKIGKINSVTLYYICKENSKSSVLQQALKQHITEDTIQSFDNLMKKIIYYKVFDTNMKLPNLSPTEQHMLQNLNSVMYLLSNTLSDHIKAPNMEAFKQMLHSSILKEKALHSQGYYTFFHGQRWNYHLIEQCQQNLWEIRKNKNIKDCKFLHIKREANTTELEKERTIRKELIKFGRTDMASRQKLFFINYALAANAINLGSNSISFVAKNENIGNINIPLKNVFEFHGYGLYYEKYKHELEDLQQLHDQASNYGNLLLIAIPDNKLHKCVYTSEVGGDKKQVTIDGIGKTDDVRLTLNTLHTAPKKINDTDEIEFCLVMTQDLALNPESGIKIFDFNAADPEKLAKYKKKSDALFEKIKQDIEYDLGRFTKKTIEEIAESYA